MYRSALLSLAALALLAGAARAAEPEETLLLQDPALSRDHVVFVYARDLWVCGREGGIARRLTSHMGAESSPRISPDGKTVAFTGQYDGNTDVYVVPIAGGEPKRLTWHPGGDGVRDWSPDGRVLFASGREGGAPVARLYLISPEGGQPEALKIPKVFHASYRRDGQRIAYTPVPDAFRSWKRYRGGRTTPVWIYDPETHEVEEIPHVDASDTFPCWVKDTVYFASDRDGHMNIFSYRSGAEVPTQLTRFKDFDVRNMSAGHGAVIFEQAGALHILEPGSSPRRLKIHVPHDGIAARPRWTTLRGFVRNMAIAPNGKRAVVEGRGEIVTMPREFGAARNITKSPGVHDRSPEWSPDGKKIAWFSDEGGEYRLMIADRRGRGEPRAYELMGAGFYYDLAWSPDSSMLAYSDKAGRLRILELEGGGIKDVDIALGTLGVYRPGPVWSPDGAWIAYNTRDQATSYDRIKLFEVASGETLTLTDRFGSASSPAFSPDNRFLFFTATVNSGPRRFGLNMSSSASRPSSSNIYVVVLQKRGANPLAARSDEGLDPEPKASKKKDAAKKEEAKSDEAKKDAAKKSKLPVIEVEGIGQRILSLPLPAGRYGNLACMDKRLLFVEFPRSGQPSIKAFDFKSRKAKPLIANATGFRVAAGGKHLLVSSGGGISITNAAGKDAKRIDANSVRIRIEPAAEWAQMLRECWRLQRDYFYDEQLHQVDWPKMWERWSAFLPHVKHRADLNLLMAEMIGELCCGHEYVSGGDIPRVTGGAPVGLLGADLSWEGGSLTIARIYRGQNWNPGTRAPLTEPGVDAEVGDVITAVNGEPIAPGSNQFKAFENTAGKRTELSLRRGGKEHRSIVVPLASDNRLRSMAWIEDNRRRVDKLSGGRLAYIYMPNTAGAGMAAFDRDFYSQLNKQGVIIDERYNRGGQVADYVVDVLSRDPICYWMNREKWVGRTPFGAIAGPKVMIVNERAGSGGDCMPWMFRKLGLGPLVGTRTWGGLVGISGYPPLMDGGRVTAASFGIMDTNGEWVVENVGVAPDVEVIEYPKDIIAGGDPQLERAVAIALRELEKTKRPEVPTYHPPSKR